MARENWAQIQEAFESGMSNGEISRTLQIDKSQLRGKVKSAGWKRRVDIDKAIEIGRERSLSPLSPPYLPPEENKKRNDVAADIAATRFEKVFNKWGQETDKVRDALEDALSQDDKAEKFKSLQSVKITTEILANLRTADMQRYGIKPAQKIEHEVTGNNNGASPLDDKLIKRLEALREVQSPSGDAS